MHMKTGTDKVRSCSMRMLYDRPILILSYRSNTCEVCAAHTTHVGNVIHILNEKSKLHEMNLGGINFYAGKILPFWKILKDLAHHLSL